MATSLRWLLLFVLLESPYKILKPYDNSFLEIEQTTGEMTEEEREIMPSLMATLLHWRTHSARADINHKKLYSRAIFEILYR